MLNYTELMESELFRRWDEVDDYNDDFQPLLESLNSDDFFRSFGDGLLSFLQMKMPELTLETAIKYIEKCCEDNGVEKSDIASTNTLKSWFKGGPRPKKGEDSRRSMFALAFALQLTPEGTTDLFHKVYLDRAFDYRDEKELVYYFCLERGRSWTDAKKLIEEIAQAGQISNDFTVHTAQIKEEIDAISDESALLSYIIRHGHNFKKRNVSAHRIKNELLDIARKTIEEETQLLAKRAWADEKKISKTEMYAGSGVLSCFADCNAYSYNHIYEVITGQLVRDEMQSGTKTLFKNARLPKEIRNRFPEALSLSKKNPTYEELRKLIILLASYNYWYRLQTENAALYIDDYIAEMNVYLEESGLSLMYFGNPYDWMFLYCALADRPLDTFRGIIAEVLADA